MGGGQLELRLDECRLMFWERVTLCMAWGQLELRLEECRLKFWERATLVDGRRVS